MKKTMKKTAAALCIAATLVSVAAPAMAVSPAEYMSTAALEECNTATVAQVESLINKSEPSRLPAARQLWLP